MNILHTSDWHLGQTLLDRKRTEEDSDFLKWLLKIIEEKKIELLLVSGDIFDTPSPGNRARQLYYNFLAGLSETGCKHAIITGGNHDSPLVLNATKDLLQTMDITVLGGMPPEKEDEVINIDDQLVVCAVPFLRDSDIRHAEAGETGEDKDKNMAEAILDHYRAVYETAVALYPGLPVIAMGHLFATGGKTIEDDGVRDLYVGNLGHTNLMSVADLFYYMALGHLHIKQKVGGQENIRYCGSPRPVGFGESGQKKIMIQLDLRGNIKEIEVPVFQHIASIKGDYSSIQAKLEKLKKEKQSCWVSIEYTGEEYIQNLPEKLEEIIQNSDVEILKIKNSRAYKEYLINKQKTVSLDQLTVTDVFNQILEENNLPEKEKEELLQTFKTTLDSIEREGKE